MTIIEEVERHTLENKNSRYLIKTTQIFDSDDT